MEQENILINHDDSIAEFLRELERLQKNAHEQKELLQSLQKTEKKLVETLEAAVEEEFQTSLKYAKAEATLLELRDSNKKLQRDFDKAKSDCVHFTVREESATKACQKIMNSQCALEARRNCLKRLLENLGMCPNKNLRRILRTLEILYKNLFLRDHVFKVIKEEVIQVWDLCNSSITPSSTLNEASICRLLECLKAFSETLLEEEQVVLKALLSYK